MRTLKQVQKEYESVCEELESLNEQATSLEEEMIFFKTGKQLHTITNTR